MSDHEPSNPAADAAFVPCVVKALPPDKLVAAARYAAEVNPANAAPLMGLAALAIADPQHLALLTGSYWGPGGVDLSVQFLDGPDAETRRMILSDEIGMNAWGKSGNVKFRETAGRGDVRISRSGGGYWSYLGTGIRFVNAAEATMNLQGFTARTVVSEYRRVVKHETGHTLGYPHEHLRAEEVARIDPQKAYVWFAAYQHWNKGMVDANVLTPLPPDSIRATAAADENSVMCYQLPGTITRDGRPIRGGGDIDDLDAEFTGVLYPLAPPPPPPPPPSYPGDVYVDDARGILWWWNSAGRRFIVQPFPGLPLRIEADASRSFVVAACGAGGPPRAVGYDYETGNKVFELNPVPHFPAGHRGGVFPSIRPVGGQVSFSGYGRWLVEVDPASGREIGAEERNPDAPAGSVLRRLIV